MLKRFSNGQLEKLLHHTAGINSILVEALLSQQDESPFEKENPFEDEIPFVSGIDFDVFTTECAKKEETSFDSRAPLNYFDADRLRREEDMSILCGRWSSGRRIIEITRVGNHFVLTVLKRNGSATDERHVLVWVDGDILYYGHEDRLTLVAHNREDDVLMLSPGVDYTRIPEEKM